MKSYIFNYNGNPNLPNYGEENISTDNYAKISLVQDLIVVYYIDQAPDTYTNIININYNINLLMISTINSAHSMCEIIDFINYYKSTDHQYVGISDIIINKMPFLYQLIKLFIPDEKIIILRENFIYKINTLITRRNRHFNYIMNWDKISFKKINNILYFDNLIKFNIRTNFICDTKFLFDKIEIIYNNHKQNYILYDNIMLVKTTDDNYVCSKNRCMDKIEIDVQKKIIDNNIKILSINDFRDIYEYICVFYHATNIILSYGGVACTNRFFCNSDANIILIANKHYESEYEYENANQNYWHVRHSHIYPAKKQTVLLDFENHIDMNNINMILSLIKL